MKLRALFIITLFFIFCPVFSQEKTQASSVFPIYKGAYLGQKPPGMVPEVFAPGIISKTGNHLHSCISISPDGKEIYFSYRAYEPEVKNSIHFVKHEGNKWTEVQVATFSGIYDDDSPTFSPDGNRLYFSSNRPIDKSDTIYDLNFWYIEKTGSNWSEPIYAGDVLNTDSCDFRLSISQNGRIFLSSDRDYKGRKSFDIFVSELIDNSYSSPEKMDSAININATEQIGFIAPDESYIVFYRYSQNNPDDTGLYISFRRVDNSWTEGLNMGEMFNAPSEKCTQAASLSPDGKYLFFLRRFDEAIYWVDAKAIEKLRSEHLK